MEDIRKVVEWLEERGAAYDFLEDGRIKAKVLLRDGERIVRVVRGYKGNLIGRIRGSSKIVVFPEVFTEFEEGGVVACRLVERDTYYIGIPLKVQSNDRVRIFWIEQS